MLFNQLAIAGDLVSDKSTLIDLPATATVEQALCVLEVYDILSLPVYVSPANGIGTGGFEMIVGAKRYLGIISVVDLVAYLFPVLQQGTSSLAERLTAPVTSALGSSGTNESNSLWVKTEQTSLLVILDLLSQGVHRALVSFGGSSCKLVTQTDVVKYLLRQPQTGTVAGLRPALLNVPLREHRIKEVVTGDPLPRLVYVNEDSPLVEALHLMLQSKVTAAPVVDRSSGRLLSQLSMSDLRGFNAAKATALVQLGQLVSVGDFLRDLHNGALPVPLSCAPEENLGDVLASMLRSRVHRAWYTDDKKVLDGVLSYTDIIAMVYAHERDAQGIDTNQ